MRKKEETNFFEGSKPLITCSSVEFTGTSVGERSARGHSVYFWSNLRDQMHTKRICHSHQRAKTDKNQFRWGGSVAQRISLKQRWKNKRITVVTRRRGRRRRRRKKSFICASSSAEKRRWEKGRESETEKHERTRQMMNIRRVCFNLMEVFYSNEYFKCDYCALPLTQWDSSCKWHWERGVQTWTCDRANYQQDRRATYTHTCPINIEFILSRCVSKW